MKRFIYSLLIILLCLLASDVTGKIGGGMIGGGGTAIWGYVTGTLSNQSDLNTALGAKLDDTQLDDTKGNGDTTYLWSADKIFDQLALKAATTRKLDDFGTPDDNTDLNASITYHGLLPKLSNVAAQYLNGVGAWTVPAGGGDVAKVGVPANHEWGIWTGDGTLEGVAVTGSKVVCTDADGEPTACTNLTDLAFSDYVTIESINTAAELETVANLGAYASDILAATSEANFKSITNLEAGTDYNTYDPDLDIYAGITPSANVQTLLGSADYATFVSNLGITSSIAELNYVTDVTGLIQAQLDARCLESTFGDAIEADDFVKTGTTLTLQAEIPHIDAAQTWTGVQTFDDLTLTASTSAPDTPVAGTIYYADNDTWNPSSISGTNNYYCLYDGAAYIALFDEDGNFFVSSIETPTLQEDEWNDEAGDRLLTDAELKGKIITNAGLGADIHFDIPAVVEGWSVIFIIEAAYQMDVHPNDSSVWYLNGTVLGADEMISNNDDTVGESMACFSTEAGKVYCESKYANFAAVAEP